MIAPETSGAPSSAVFAATIVFSIRMRLLVAVPWLIRPPPVLVPFRLARLPLTVQLRRGVVPRRPLALLLTAPPPTARLAEKVQLTAVTFPCANVSEKLCVAPPKPPSAMLPLKVQLLI